MEKGYTKWFPKMMEILKQKIATQSVAEPDTEPNDGETAASLLPTSESPEDITIES